VKRKERDKRIFPFSSLRNTRYDIRTTVFDERQGTSGERRLKNMRVACIDIGTLTCRVLIGDVDGHGPVKTVYSGRKILRLGEGVDRTKQLKPEAMTRVIEAIREWQEVIDRHDVHASTAVATSAVREARNREEFLQRVK